MGEEMDNNKSVKIGARILSKKAFDKLLPTNGNIEEQIKEVRKLAVKYRKEKERQERQEPDIAWDREFDRHNNNIFSILGGRGSGKTSALLTIKHNITKKQYDTDIILPLIVPEKMGEISDILGCLLGLLGDKVGEIENIIFYEEKSYFEGRTDFKDYFENCRKKQNNPIREKYNNLLKQYRYTQKDYREIILKEYEGFSSYIDEASNILDSDQKLVVRFEEFIDELILIKKKINLKDKKIESKDLIGDEREPLFIVFFDDVDLNIQKCEEVLNVILRYLSHPNIVVFIAGDYNTFSEVLTIHSLKKDGILNDQMQTHFLENHTTRGLTALECRQIFTQDLLKKVMPPAYRYNIPTLSDKLKAEFIYSTEEDDKCSDADEQSNSKNINPQYYNLVELLIKNFIDSNCNIGDYENKKYTDSFFYYKGTLIYDYFKIFDNCPRGLMNVYSFLYSTKESQSLSEEERCIRLRHFLNTIMYSSSVLSKYSEDINKIFEIGNCFEDTFIDYKYIESMIENKELNQTRYSNQKELETNKSYNRDEDIATLFILANFLENIIVEETKKLNPKSARRVHGMDVLLHILNSKNNNFILYPNTKDHEDIDMILYLHSNICMQIPESNIRGLTEYGNKDYFLSKYFEIINDIIKLRGNAKQEDKQEDKQETISDFFRKMLTNDKEWVGQKIKIIMHHGGGDIIILKDKIEDIIKWMDSLKMDTEYSNKITDGLRQFYEEAKENKSMKLWEFIKSDLISKSILKYDTDGKIKLTDVEEKYIDYLRYVENTISPENSKRTITEELKESYESLMSNKYFDNIKILKRLENIIKLDCISESKYQEYLRSFRYDIRREQMSSYNMEADINNLYTIFSRLPIINYDLELISHELDELDLNDICMDYVKIMTLIGIRDREEREEQEQSEKQEQNDRKNKKTFYQLFECLKDELMKDNKFKGFAQFIKAEEIKSKELRINVKV